MTVASVKDHSRNGFRDNREAAKERWPSSLPVSSGANRCGFDFVVPFVTGQP